MYDHIVCRVSLPGTRAKWEKPDSVYQTKDTPNQWMSTYAIEADGLKLDGKLVAFTGTITFYESNSSGGWGEVRYSSDGEDVESVTYLARFHDGKLRGIEQTEYERCVTIQSVGRQPLQPTAEEDYSVPLVGKRVYIRYGGSSNGFWATVIAENDRKVAMQVATGDGRYVKEGDLMVEHKSFGNIMFFSEEAAKAKRASRDAEYQRELDRYNARKRQRKEDNKKA